MYLMYLNLLNIILNILLNVYHFHTIVKLKIVIWTIVSRGTSVYLCCRYNPIVQYSLLCVFHLTAGSWGQKLPLWSLITWHSNDAWPMLLLCTAALAGVCMCVGRCELVKERKRRHQSSLLKAHQITHPGCRVQNSPHRTKQAKSWNNKMP